MIAKVLTSITAAESLITKDPEGCEFVAILESLRRHQRLHAAAEVHPIVILEGLDGTGKSTLACNLQERLAPAGFQSMVTLLQSPPEELQHLRPHFDAQPPAMRRAFYSLGNYACALKMHEAAAVGPVVVDRFWPSTVAYALARDLEQAPAEATELLTMP